MRSHSDLAGFLNVNKPAGYTSHDVVALVRRWTLAAWVCLGVGNIIFSSEWKQRSSKPRK